MTDPLTTGILGGAGAIVVMILLVCYRVVVGPSVQDRLIALNVAGTSTVILIALLAAGLDRPSYLDIALVYALLNFVFSLAIAKFTFQEGEVL